MYIYTLYTYIVTYIYIMYIYTYIHLYLYTFIYVYMPFLKTEEVCFIGYKSKRGQTCVLDPIDHIL